MVGPVSLQKHGQCGRLHALLGGMSTLVALLEDCIVEFEQLVVYI
jgi:hypothetical protein